jgi:N-acetylglucosamine malate deacetylase 1
VGEIIDALVIAAHPDDAEIGVGGTLAMLSAAGKKSAIVDLTDGEPTPHGSPEIRAKESIKATEILGVTNRINLGLKNRELFDNVEARKKIASTLREYRPNVLFLPYGEDAHPDHVATYQLGTAARFYSKFVKSDLTGEPWHPKRVFYYFGFHLRNKITPSFIVSIDAHMEAKMNAIKAYSSQFVVHEKNQGVLNDIEADNRYWGTKIHSKYGEPFVSDEHLRVTDAGVLLEL